jgi:hypothetical protein
MRWRVVRVKATGNKVASRSYEEATARTLFAMSELGQDLRIELQERTTQRLIVGGNSVFNYRSKNVTEWTTRKTEERPK